MKFFRHSNGFFTLLTGLGLVLGGLLNSCAGGVDGGGSPGGGATQTGTVAVLLTDAPSDDFSQVIVTVDEVSLLSSDGREFTVFKGPREIDLLALQDIQDLFMVHPEVPVGIYDRIRLHVKDLKLVTTDQVSVSAEDVVFENQVVTISLGSNPVQVLVDKTVTVQLDLDVDQSINDLGVSPGRYRFRPVVLVEFLIGLPTRLVRASGEIVEIDPNTNSFLLKRTDPKFSDLGNGDDNRPRLIRVEVPREARIFDANGLPDDFIGTFETLATGQHVHVRGLLSIQGGLHIEASLIEIGDRFDRLRGTITSDLDSQNRFGFCPDPYPCSDITHPSIQVQVYDETLILGQLKAGRRAIIDGVKDGANLFHAAVIVVKPNLTSHDGIIGDLDSETRTFSLTSSLPCADAQPPCLLAPVQIISVHVIPDAVILRVSLIEDDHVRIEPIPFDSLRDGDRAHVFGYLDNAGTPFHALEVITYSTQPLP